MDLRVQLKKSLTICNGNVISDQTFKSLVRECILELSREKETLGINRLCVSKPDVIKELHSSLLETIAEFARHNCRREFIYDFLLNECGLSSSRANILCDEYEQSKTKIQIILGNIGSHLPNVVDVKWKLNSLIKGTDIEDRNLTFQVSLVVEVYDAALDKNRLDTVDFICTVQELKDLVYKLREAMRHCMKIATER